MFRPTSVMEADSGDKFVSSMEAVFYPFYGLQFHTEKQYLSFTPGHGFNHDWQVEKANRKFADFFVG